MALFSENIKDAFMMNDTMLLPEICEHRKKLIILSNIVIDKCLKYVSIFLLKAYLHKIYGYPYTCKN